MRVFNVTLLFMYFWRAFKKTYKSLSYSVGHISHTQLERWWSEPALLSLLLFFLLMFLANIHMFLRVRECCPISKLSHHICIIFYPDTPTCERAANDYWSQFWKPIFFYLDHGKRIKSQFVVFRKKSVNVRSILHTRCSQFALGTHVKFGRMTNATKTQSHILINLRLVTGSIYVSNHAVPSAWRSTAAMTDSPILSPVVVVSRLAQNQLDRQLRRLS